MLCNTCSNTHLLTHIHIVQWWQMLQEQVCIHLFFSILSQTHPPTHIFSITGLGLTTLCRGYLMCRRTFRLVDRRLDYWFGSTVVRWLALSFWVESACFPSRYSGFLPQSKGMHVRLNRLLGDYIAQRCECGFMLLFFFPEMSALWWTGTLSRVYLVFTQCQLGEAATPLWLFVGYNHRRWLL